jgi:hypothetical protein
MRSARRPLRRLVPWLTAAFVLVSAGYALGQFRGRALNVSMVPAQLPDGDFAICRLMYNEAHRFEGGWRTDHPLGERNLSVRLAELTRTRVSKGRDGSPNHYVVRPTDDQLFACPFIMVGDAGSAGFDEYEATRMREYLLKGGFLWTDDMWGEAEWESWKEELAKVFPPDTYPIEEITPADPVFRGGQYVVKDMPQIPNLPHWQRSGGTSEMGAESAVPHFHVVRDQQGRIMVAMTRNTDIADSFEREAEDPVYFSQFSPKGYALGINILLYAMTH